MKRRPQQYVMKLLKRTNPMAFSCLCIFNNKSPLLSHSLSLKRSSQCVPSHPDFSLSLVSSALEIQAFSNENPFKVQQPSKWCVWVAWKSSRKSFKAYFSFEDLTASQWLKINFQSHFTTLRAKRDFLIFTLYKTFLSFFETLSIFSNVLFYYIIYEVKHF